MRVINVTLEEKISKVEIRQEVVQSEFNVMKLEVTMVALLKMKITENKNFKPMKNIRWRKN